jgi:hypothetical protein
MQVNLFRTIKQKGKFVWPHPSHVSLLPKLLQHNYDSASAARGNGGYEPALPDIPIFGIVTILISDEYRFRYKL